LRQDGIDCFGVSEGILKKISGTRYLIPFIGVVRLREVESDREMDDFVLVLDGVQDHGNIGTILRTAAGFGIRDILSTRSDLDLYYRKTIEASRGKVFDIRLRRFESGPDTIAFLKRRGFQLAATSPHAPSLQAAARLRPQPLALVVGNETQGVSAEILEQADMLVRIPMSGQLESLNVGVATGISVYEFKIKWVIAMLTKQIRSTLGREVNVAGKLIQMALDKRLDQVSELNAQQLILMMVLKCDQRMSRSQAQKDMAATGEELDQLLQPLLENEYIACETGSRDILTLSPHGETLLGQIWGVIESSQDEILDGFSPDERQQLADFLQRIQANCHRIIDS
jgi:TrmH family RNA methyltransferase